MPVSSCVERTRRKTFKPDVHLFRFPRNIGFLPHQDQFFSHSARQQRSFDVHLKIPGKGGRPERIRGTQWHRVYSRHRAGTDGRLQGPDAAGTTATRRESRGAGTDRTRLLSATVYITDMSRKPILNEVWDAWIGPDHWPQRACVEAGLGGDTLVEIVAIAAKQVAHRE